MIKILYVLILALTVNIDSLIMGVTYSLKNIKVPLISRILISFLNIVFSYIAVYITYILKSSINNYYGKIFGASILLVMGTMVIIKALFSKKDDITLVEKADCNHSKTIEPIETIFLTLALSIDNIFINVSTTFTSNLFILLALPLATGLFQYLSFLCGNYMGKKFNSIASNFLNEKYMNILSGCIFIALGISRII